MCIYYYFLLTACKALHLQLADRGRKAGLLQTVSASGLLIPQYTLTGIINELPQVLNTILVVHLELQAESRKGCQYLQFSHLQNSVNK